VFFDEAMPPVFGYALRLTAGNHQQAWDLTQEAWLKVISDLNRGEALRPSVGLLITVVRSRFIDQLRRSKRLPAKLALVWPGERTVDDVDPSDVVAALDQLQPEHRAVLMMVYVDDLHVDDVARALGVSRSTTYSLMERARNELRAVIGDDHA
jgi:RNA polymerase sigma-70 factor (ECF subfamily)